MEDELQGMRGEERHFRGGRGRGIRGGGGPRGRKRRDLKPKEVMERERLEKLESPPECAMIVTSSPSMRTPIILTKPEKFVDDSSKKDPPTILAIQRRSDYGSESRDERGISDSGNRFIENTSTPHYGRGYHHHRHNRSSLASEKQLEHGFTQTSANNTPTHQAPQTTSHVDQHIATGLEALQMNSTFYPTESTNLIDMNFNWSDRAIETLMEQSDFIVVGCVGLQGSGKSTVMSMIADPKDIVEKGKLLFRPQRKSDMEKAVHRTVGIDIFVTKERMILLDTQPLLSPSMLDQYLRYDRKVPTEFSTAEICLEVQALQILTFLYTVCHVVLVVQDHFTDLNLLNLLKTAEMLKPSTVSHTSQDNSSISNDDLNEHFPYVGFVYNCCDPCSFQVDVVESMCEVTSKMFEHSRIRVRGSTSIMRMPVLPYHNSNLLRKFHDLNIFLLPALDPVNGDDDDFNPISRYKGHPSFTTLTYALRNQLSSMPREHLTHHTLTEKNWFHYAARTWEAVKKSPLVAEYHRLLTS